MRDPARRAAILDELLVFGSRYEGVLVFGAEPADVALLERRGFVTDFAQGTFWDGHFEGCPVEIRITPRADGRGVSVSGGVGQAEIWSATFSEAGPYIRASLQTLCADVWVRVAWQGTTERCQNADAEGRIHVRAGRGVPAPLRCE